QIKGTLALHNNDGLVFIDDDKVLRGLKVNRVEGDMIYVAKAPLLPRAGTAVYRNYDHEFLSALEKDRSVRKIIVSIEIGFEAEKRLIVRAVDEDNIIVENEYTPPTLPARNARTSAEGIQKHFSKSGATPFYVDRVKVTWESAVFIPASLLNAYRQEILRKLEEERVRSFRPVPYKFPDHDAVFPYDKLDFSFNVSNKLARRFYKRHGVQQIDKALELEMPPGEIAVMTTKHCLRYELGFCVKRPRSDAKGKLNEPLFLYNKDGIYKLGFDCGGCFMKVVRV
ncbi:MAG: DUF3656 domain-containing protein, partial [Nitrospirae bacterium]|nr:DUF3656 domain-containing protein [Nitrospirota bacterium]